MTERRARMSRMSVVVSIALTSLVVGVVVSCSESQPAAGGAGTTSGAGACATPQTGCACTPGSVAACGVRFDGDQNFIYCYEGQRRCGPNGVYGECKEGTIVAKSLASSSLHTSALGTPGPCTGVDTGPLDAEHRLGDRGVGPRQQHGGTAWCERRE